MSCGSKINSKIHPVSCANIHHDVTYLINHGIVKVQKLGYLENGT